MKKYEVRPKAIFPGKFDVVEIEDFNYTPHSPSTKEDKQEKVLLYNATICECYSYIKLKEGNYINDKA